MNEAYNTAVRNPILQVPTYQYSPDTTRLTLEQEYNRLSNRMTPQNQTNAYTDYIATLNTCSDVTKRRILSDDRFDTIYSQCEALLKEYLYSQALPYVLETQQGRMAFEQLYNTTKALKEEYTQRDVQKERQLELLMQDEVVLRRLQELQNEPPTEAKNQSSTSSQQPQKKWNIAQAQQQRAAQEASNEVTG